MIMKNCLYSEDARYRHDLSVAFTQLIERTIFASRALLKKANKEVSCTFSDLADYQEQLSPDCQVME